MGEKSRAIEQQASLAQGGTSPRGAARPPGDIQIISPRCPRRESYTPPRRVLCPARFDQMRMPSPIINDTGPGVSIHNACNSRVLSSTSALHGGGGGRL